MATTAASLQVFVGADINQALSGLNKVSSSVKSFTGDVAKSALGFGIATVGLDAFGSLADILKKASGVGLARDLENVNAQFTAMLGSGDLAAAMIEDIRVKADQTPFGFIELAKGAASLVPIFKRTGAPMDEMLKTVMMLAAFDPAQGIEGATFALREFAAGDYVSLKRRFEIDTDPIEKLIAKGVPGLKALNTVLAQNGITMALVEARAKTTEGRLNTFADLLGSISLEAGKPILGAFGLELDRVSGLITGNLGPLKEFAATIGTRIGGAMNTLGQEVGTFFTTAKNIAGAHGVGGIDAAIIALRGRIAEVFGEEAGKKIDSFVETIKGIPTAFTGISDAITGIRKDFARFVIDLSTLPGIGDKFNESATAAREFLGMPALAPGSLPDGRPRVYTNPTIDYATGRAKSPLDLPGSEGLKGLSEFGAPIADAFGQLVSGADLWVQRAGAWAFPDFIQPPQTVTLLTTVNTGPVNASDPEDVARMADMIAEAQRRTMNGTGSEAPGA